MEIFTDAGIALLFRWAHFLAGVTWIGILYYFNFAQGAFVAQATPEVKSAVTRQLAPRVLWWFRWAALVTWVAGVALITWNIEVLNAFDGNWGDYFNSSYGTLIISGMGLGTLMFLNVWGVIWRNQKVVIASAEAVAGGGSADPKAADLARRAFLASRTNVVFSIPMLFFMAAASHLNGKLGAPTGRIPYIIVALVAVLGLEYNAVMGGLTGGMTKPLEKVNSTLWTGFILWVVLYGVLEIIK